jgi:hypothetical protein
MKLIRENSEKQVSKLDATMNVAEVLNEAYSCGGECNDCDNCQGPITH